MSPSERAAIKGVLADLRPELAIEIGTAEGGSLRRIAAQARLVHAFDRDPPDPELLTLANVSFHVGDSHELLPRVLGQLTEQEVNVDFVLVDGDHSAEGARRDVEDLLSSPAISRTLVFVHDTANPDVRAGLEAIPYREWAKLTWVDLDWLPGIVFREGPTRGEAWGGLGLLIADAESGPAGGPTPVARYAYPVPDLVAGHARLASCTTWRLTRPLAILRKAVGR